MSEADELRRVLLRREKEIEELRKQLLEERQTVVRERELAEELRSARDELAGQKSLLDAILSLTPSGVIVSEAPSGRITFAGAQAENIWRRPFRASDDTALCNHFSGFHADGRPYEPEEWPPARSISSGEIVAGEKIEFMRGDSTRGTMHMSSSPLRNREGSIVGAVTVFHDISGRKLMEETIRRSEEDLRRTFDESPVGAAIVGLDYRFELVNDALCRITGYSKEELTSLTFMDITHPDDLSLDSATTERLQGGETERYQMEKRYIRKDGSTVWVNLHARLVRDGEGKSLYYLPLIEDITERKEAEEALKKARDELEQRVIERTAELARANDVLKNYAARLELTNQELQEFVFVASHDLQEPLRKIQTFGSIISGKYRDALDEEGKDHLTRMIESGKRMQALILDLLKYSRLTMKPAPLVQIDLRIPAEEAVNDLSIVILEACGSVEISEMPAAEVDPLQIQVLFQHLISNAFKYRGEQKPVIKIYGNDCLNGTCRIYVEDNGIGFDERYLDRIFRPFQRLHGRSAYDGTGMGLAICRKIVHLHSGSITARSSSGKGSTFVITLPLRRN